jgi:UDP-glucuronate 4-epimerase
MDMITWLGEALGIEPQLNMLPMQPGDVNATYADVELVQRKLGFKPTTPLREGLRRFVEWYRAHPELASAVSRASKAG